MDTTLKYKLIISEAIQKKLDVAAIVPHVERELDFHDLHSGGKNLCETRNRVAFSDGTMGEIVVLINRQTMEVMCGMGEEIPTSQTKGNTLVNYKMSDEQWDKLKQSTN